MGTSDGEAKKSTLLFMFSRRPGQEIWRTQEKAIIVNNIIIMQYIYIYVYIYITIYNYI